MATLDIRQSDNWSTYLEMYGWGQFKLSNNAIVRYRKTPFGLFAKLQRPTNLTDTELIELDEICKKNKVLVLKFEPGVEQDIKTVLLHDFVKIGEPHLATKTLTINLKKTEDELWKELSQNAKRSVKRAGICGVHVYETKDIGANYLEFHKLLAKTGSRKGFYVQSLDEIRKKAEAFSNESYLFNAYDELGVLCSSQLYLGYNKSAWSFHGTTSALGLHNNAGYKLLWEACLGLKKRGYETVDLEGIADNRYPKFTKTWGGFSDYKLKFGGEIVIFPETYTKVFSKPLDLLLRLGFVL